MESERDRPKPRDDERPRLWAGCFEGAPETGRSGAPALSDGLPLRLAGDELLRNPMTGDFPGCCARAANGHAITVPPRSVMTSRRLMLIR
jgi:hypothetical protein